MAGPCPWRVARTASTPSAEVPDIRPMTRSTCEVFTKICGVLLSVCVCCMCLVVSRDAGYCVKKFVRVWQTRSGLSSARWLDSTTVVHYSQRRILPPHRDVLLCRFRGCVGYEKRGQTTSDCSE